VDPGAQHGRSLALSQNPGGDHQLEQLLGIGRADDVQDLAQQLLLVGEELDFHLEEIMLVMLGALELRDPAVQTRCGTDQRLKLAAQRPRIAKKRRR